MSDRRALDLRIVSIAVPAAGSALLQVIHGAVDMVFVAGLGTDALAALAIAMTAVWMFGALGTLVATGLGSLVARYVGSGRPDAAGYAAAQGLRWAVVLGVLAGGGGALLAPAVFAAADAAPAVAREGTLYTRILWGGGALVVLQQAGDAVFRGHGNARVPFLVGLVSLAANAALDPVLIYGLGPVPALGVAGAAWATLAATLLGASLLVLALARRGHLVGARPSDERLRLAPATLLGRPGRLGLDPSILRRVARVGAPVALAGLLFTLVYLGIHRIAAEAAGSPAQAGLGVGHRGEGVAFVISLGWAAAAATLVGQALGAGDPRRAERAAWRAVLHAALLCAAWGAFLLAFGEEVAGLLAGDDPADAEARAHAVAYYRIVAVCLGPQAVELVLEGAFGGAGLTVPAMVISTFFSVVRIPVAAVTALGPASGVPFGLGLGPAAIWWTISITALLRGVAAALWFLRGTWKARGV